MDSRKRQTSTGTPAEPGGLPLTLGSMNKAPIGVFEAVVTDHSVTRRSG